MEQMADYRGVLHLLRMLEANMPVFEVVHSLHTQALRDPAVRQSPAMERFSDVGETNLHAMVAAAGYIRRLLVGDRSPGVLEGLQEQLGIMVRTHRDAKAAFAQLMTNPEARQNVAVQSLSQVMGLADQVNQAMRPLVAPLVAPEVYTDAH